MSESTRFDASGLVEHLCWLGRSLFTGRIQSVDTTGQPVATWAFVDGRITDLGLSDEVSFLDGALSPSPNLKDKDRKRIRKVAETDGRDAGELILEEGLLPPEEVSQRILTAIVGHFAEFLSHQELEVETVECEPGEPMTLARVLDVDLAVDETLILAAELVGRFDLIADSVSVFKDVYYATPNSFGLVQDPESYPVEVEVINQLDGERDLLEVVQSCTTDPFTILSVVQRLHDDGLIAMINPVQLFQLGCDLEKTLEFDRARRRFERAEERGLDDFDLSYRLAETYRKLERTREAVRFYLAFADKCATQFRIEDAIRACSRVVELDPTNLTVQEKYLQLLIQYGDSRDALRIGLELADNLCDQGRESGAAAALHALYELELEGSDLERYLELCNRAGYDRGIVKARKELGDVFLKQQETEKALDLYQDLFVQGEDTAEVRSRLAELHFQSGNLSEGRDHLLSLSRFEGWSPRRPTSATLEYFTHLRDIQSGEPLITGWLVDAALASGEHDRVANLLKEHMQALLGADRGIEAVRIADRVLEWDPVDTEAAFLLAAHELKRGSVVRARGTIFRLLDALRAEDLKGDDDPHPEEAQVETTQSILRRWLELYPHCEEGRAKLIEVLDGKEREAVMVELSVLRLFEQSVDFDEHLGPLSESLGPEPYYLFGRLLQLRGDSSRAMQLFHGYAQHPQALDKPDFYRMVVEALEELTPEDPEISTYRGRLETHLGSLTPAPAPVEASPAAASKPTTQTDLRDQPAPSAPAPSTSPSLGRGTSGRSGSIKAKPLAAVAKLKAIKGGPASPPATPEPLDTSPANSASASGDSAQPERPKPPPTPKKSAPLSAVQKLQALKNGGATPKPSPPPAPVSDESSEVEAAPPPEPAKPVKLGGAASKLSALRNQSS